MSRKKLIVLIVFSYLVFPLLAGIFDLGGDRRGPRVFWIEHHEPLFRLGYHIARGSEPVIPVGRDREWWY